MDELMDIFVFYSVKLTTQLANTNKHAHAPHFVQTVKLGLKENRTHAGR